MLRAAKHLDVHPHRPFAALKVTSKGHSMQRRAISALLPAVLALWNPGPVSSVDAYRGNGTRSGSDEDGACTGVSTSGPARRQTSPEPGQASTRGPTWRQTSPEPGQVQVQVGQGTRTGQAPSLQRKRAHIFRIYCIWMGKIRTLCQKYVYGLPTSTPGESQHIVALGTRDSRGAVLALL